MGAIAEFYTSMSVGIHDNKREVVNGLTDEFTIVHYSWIKFDPQCFSVACGT